MNRLWIEKFSDEKWSLLQTIGKIEEGLALSDTVMEKVSQDFMVRSFAEFIEKCDPCVYLYLDFTNNVIGFSRSREADLSELGMEGEAFFLTPECIRLYHPDGAFEQIGHCLHLLHQGKKLILSAEDRKDWFFSEMMAKDEKFTEQIATVVEHREREEVIQGFLQEYDDGMFLLRRLLYRDWLYQNQKMRFALLKDEANGQLRPVEHTGYLRIPRRSRREKNEWSSQLLSVMKEIPLRHKELLYWNCMLEVCGAELYSKQELRAVMMRTKNLYHRGMELFWECAAPMIHSMFQIQKHFETTEGFLLFSNCEPWEMVEQREYVERFLETTNTKLDKAYEIKEIVLEGLKRESLPQKPVRQRFVGTGEKGKKNQKNEDLAIKIRDFVRKFQVETVFHFVEDQTEDIYEFLSRDR